MNEYMDLTARLNEAAELQRTGRERVAEGVRRLEHAERLTAQNYRQGNSVRLGLNAGALQDWKLAPAVRDKRDATAARWGITPRYSHSFYLDEPLAQRTLTSATATGAAELVDVAHTLRVTAQHDTAAVILGLMTDITSPGVAGNQMIGRLDTLPTGAVLANETANATDETAVAGQSILTPRNITTFTKWSGAFALQSEAGAAAVARLAAAGLRNKLLQQILAGSGSNGEIDGLLNISAVPTTNAGTLTWAMVADTIADVEANSSGENLAWVCTAAAAEVMRQRGAVSGVSAILDGNNRIGGFPCFVTGCSTSAFAVFGAWRDLLLYQFSPIEIASDPYGVNGANFQARQVSVRGWISADAAPLLNGSFSTLHSIT